VKGAADFGGTMTLTPHRGGFPDWLPDSTRLYLRHTEDGMSIRAIAREEGCHASTILRRIRSCENRRDDPLFDAALTEFGRLTHFVEDPSDRSERMKESTAMTAPIRHTQPAKITDDATVKREARRILRRLCEVGALLAVAPEMEKAAVLKGDIRTAVVDCAVAQVFALNEWIAVEQAGRITTYKITATGRSALKRLLEEEHGGAPSGFAEAQSVFAAQHRVWGERAIHEAGEDQPRRMRFNLAESPLALLGRRKDKDGKPFLTPDLVAAGERLREDFELAQMGPRIAQNWERFLTAGDRGSFGSDGGIGGGSGRARERVAAALRDLGPGLGDMVLRCCCFLEGLEAAEKRLGWSARSGKIVLRIALVRLKRHYDEVNGGKAPLIG
jgi:transposase-like protein